MPEGGGRWVGSNKVVELKKKEVRTGDLPSSCSGLRGEAQGFLEGLWRAGQRG